MKICLITSFPPSKERLNEYGLHIARELQRDPFLSVTVLADELSTPQPELPEFDVVRCWKFCSLSTPWRLLKTVREIKPDVVWFNVVFSTFGDRPVPAFFGLCIPMLLRMCGYYTHVTLHHLIEILDLSAAGIRFPRLYQAAGSIATRILLMANSISVLLPGYRRTLIEKYRGNNVHLRAHGVLSASPQYPDFSQRGNPEHRILAFGKWGTYKRVEILIEAFARVAEKVPNAKLVIAGSNHPIASGYLESLAERFRGSSRIEFIGYIPEEQLSEVFQRSTVMVMPYSSAGGPSGVAHNACQFGVPIICADIPDFRDMAEDEDIAIDFYENGDSDSLAERLLALLQDPQRQRAMAEENFSAALRITMPQIVRKYLRSFNLDQKTKALEPISRFRRIPAWVPSRSAIFRAAVPRWLSWM